MTDLGSTTLHHGLKKQESESIYETLPDSSVC